MPIQNSYSDQAEICNAMPESWWRDNELNAELKKILVNNRNMRLYWPTGMHGQTTWPNKEDYSTLKNMPEKVFVMPINNGNHWQPMIVRKTNDGFRADIIQTRADGTCGLSTAEQVEILSNCSDLEQELKNRLALQESAEGSAKQMKLLTPRPKQSARASNGLFKKSDTKEATQRSRQTYNQEINRARQEQDDLTRAIKNSRSELENGTQKLEILLFDMAEAKLSGKNQRFAELKNEIIDCLPDNPNEIVDRLKDSGLAEKEEIQEIIAAAEDTMGQQLSQKHRL